MDKAARAALLTAKGTNKKRAGYADGGGFSPTGNPAMFEGVHHDLTNEDGSLLDLWHGTPQEKEFEAFDDKKIGSENDYGFHGRGHYLTASPSMAEQYSAPDGRGTVIGPLRAALKNPYIWDVSNDNSSHRTLRDLQSMGIMKHKDEIAPWDNLQRHHIEPFMAEMRKRGHDGVIKRTASEDGRPYQISEVIAFNPNTIKHKDAELFDPNDPRIRRDDGGTVGKSKGGALDLARAVMAKDRAGGQIAPSKYLPNVPRQVHAGGGKVAFQEGNHPDVPDVLYHGNAPQVAYKGWTRDIDHEQTQKNLEAQDFRTFKPSEYGSYGAGIYLSDSPKVASDFAQSIRSDQKEPQPFGQVLKLHVSMKQPFTDDTLRHPAWRDHIKDAIKQGLWLGGINDEDKAKAAELTKKLDDGTATVRDLFLTDTQHGAMVNQFGQQNIHKTIRNSGFDGIIAHRPDGSKEYVAFKPEQVKSAIGNQGTFDPNDPDITKAEGGRIHAEGGGKMELRSKAADAIRNQAQLKGSVDQLLAVASKGKGVKQAELANAGRPSGNIISKEELARHFENALPNVQVEKYGEIAPVGHTEDEKKELNSILEKSIMGTMQNEDTVRLRELRAKQQPTTDTKYGKWTLDTGKNYREHLLHMPPEGGKVNHRVFGAYPRDFDTEAEAHAYIDRINRWAEQEGMEAVEENLGMSPLKYHPENERAFQSSHWSVPNVVAHVRMKDLNRGDDLFVQEIQSDWGQNGREQGFYDPERPYEVVRKGTKEVVSRHPDYSSMWDAYRTHPDADNLNYGDVRDEKIPHAPYVGNTQQWTDLALKHVLTEAAKGGHKRVVFAPGQANADLYGQRQPISQATLQPVPGDTENLGHLHTWDKNSDEMETHGLIKDEKELASQLGKKHAQALLSQPLVRNSHRSLAEPDMYLGGHGMVDYYNNIVHPSALKLLQQHDPSIQPEKPYTLPSKDDESDAYKGYSIPMTETARQSILKNGFGAFKRGGTVGKNEGGSVTDSDEFRNWFGNSVTHTDGDPHVFYTGTSKDKDFTAFNVGRHGAWFTRDPAEASSYAEQNDSQGYKQDGWKLTPTNTASRVIPAYVKAENPYTGDLPDEVLRSNYKAAQSDWFDTLRRKGHDAWVPARHNGNLVVVLKEPQQIKSIFNNGKFDPNQKHMGKAGGGTVDDDPAPVIQNPMSVFPKPQRMFPEDQRPKGGQYISAHNKADVTGHKAEAATIGIGPTGKPFFQASQNAVDQTGTVGKGSATTKTNLFKQKAGWKWQDAPEGHENTETIVSVEHRGKHFYALNAHFPKGVDLARYENAPSEPRLRPTTQGNVTLGPQAGSISVRGKMHPVYHHVIVKADGGAVDDALALTRRFTKDGTGATMALKSKEN